jgi:hypothetical protein
MFLPTVRLNSHRDFHLSQMTGGICEYVINARSLARLVKTPSFGMTPVGASSAERRPFLN